MNLILSLLLLAATSCAEDAPPKSKRTINPNLLLYPDQQAYYPDGAAPKQVAHQQVVYEFQQTPTNAVSNVQYYQQLKQDQEAHTPPPIISSSESVALPVQHSALVRHGPALQQFQPLPAAPQHIQTQQYIPGRYLYVNGKIIYQPNAVLPGAPRLNYLGYQSPQLVQKLTPPPLSNQPFQRFSPPVPSQIQSITKPVTPPQEEEQQEEEEESDEPAEEEEEDDDVGYEDEDDYDGRHFGRYRFDKDEEAREEEEDEDDSDRGSSRNVARKQPKKSRRNKNYDDGNKYKYSEKYSTSSKHGNKYSKNGKTKKPKKMQYKSVKYMRETGGEPRGRGERIEGWQSENVPVVKKVFKEKWYVSKSTDDSP